MIVISEAAMKEAEKKMKMEEPDEGVLALSQSMILPSTSSGLKKPVENEAALAADTGEIVVLVTQVHRPSYFIADKKCKHISFCTILIKKLMLRCNNVCPLRQTNVTYNSFNYH